MTALVLQDRKTAKYACLDHTNQGPGSLDAISAQREHSRREAEQLSAISAALESISQRLLRQLARHASLDCSPSFKGSVRASRALPILGPKATVGQQIASAMLAITTCGAGL
jgi:hypothetical protein